MNQVYNYALIKSLFDKGQSYIDSFLVFVVHVLKLEQPLDLVSIQKELKHEYALEMPLHVLSAVLKSAKRKGYAGRQDKDYQLTEKGKQYLESFETDKAVERRINALLEDLRQFFISNDITLSIEQLLSLLTEFLHSNIEPLVEFVNPSIVNELSIQDTDGNHALIVEYLRLAEKQKPNEYNTIRDMVIGSIISTILYTEEFTEIDELTRSKFRNCNVFLDTNYILSLLGIDDHEQNEAAKELLDLIQKHGFRIHVFDFTIDEITGLLSHYTKEEHRYPTTLNISSISSKLKRKGWSKSDVTLFIASIDENLDKLGIKVKWGTAVNIKTYIPKDDDLRNKIRQYKSEQGTLSQNHDLAAVEQIRQYRVKPVRRLEHCEAIFLTSDTRLSRFNIVGMGHKEKETMSEVMLDRLLTVILWLKNPSAKIPLSSVIAAHSKEAIISRPVWDRFYDVLKELKEAGQVNDENISTLFYNNYIEDSLSELSDSELERITKKFVIAQMEKAAKAQEEEKEEILEKQQSVIREKEAEFLQQLLEERTKTEYEKDREWIDKIKESKESIYSHTRKSVSSYVLAIKITLAIVLFLPLIICLAFCLIKDDWTILGNVWKIISPMLGILGIVQLFIPKVWEILQEKWTDRLFKKRVKEANLDQYMLEQ